jgi:purine-nucleoside phosphorylase
MLEHKRQLEASVRAWHDRGWPAPSVLLVSGSGLAVDLGFVVRARSELGDLLPFPAHAIVGHPHRIELLSTEYGTVLYQRGRLHSYQGYDANQTVFVVRLAGLLGAVTLVMTNAAGGLGEGQRPGRLAVISDQINLSGLNPLRGSLPPDWGPQFPDMVGAHDPQLRALALKLAADLDIGLGTGVYAGLAGPSFETAAEVEMLERLGVDLVGMSTVLEVIAARHLGMRSLCFSLVANLAAGVADQPIDHEEVLQASQGATGPIASLLTALLERPEVYSRDS